MTVNLIKREEEEAIFKKRLLFDGHGAGEDKRLISLLKNITKFCVPEEAGEDVAKLFNMISREFFLSLYSAQRNQKVIQMSDKEFEDLDRAIAAKQKEIDAVKLELVNLELGLEYVEKLKKVEAYPDCQTTEEAMREIERRKQILLAKIEKQKNSILQLVEICKNLQKILEDDEITDSYQRGDKTDSPMKDASASLGSKSS